jgi:hypothetical protein
MPLPARLHVRSGPARFAIVVAPVLALLALVGGMVGGIGSTNGSPDGLVDTAVPATAAPVPAVGSGTGALSLGISVTPGIICVSNNPGCPSSEQVARVTLQADAPQLVTTTYPAVQVVFLLETTLYDGVYDGSLGVPGRENCADSSSHMPCEESNGVPFFVANAGEIAASIASANPKSSVTFGLVNFFSTGDVYDKFSVDAAQGLESVAYHVDVGTPVPANAFEEAVTSTFQSEVLDGGWVYPGLNFGNNILHSDSITALYGVLMGYGINWIPNAHHVLVLIGSTAPRDPAYVQDYCVSPSSAWRYACYGPSGPYSSGCEPSYQFGVGASPQCVAWINSRDGNANDSIAGLARAAPDCLHSLGGRCTIDVIDLWTTSTDPFSNGWPSAPQGGPGGAYVVQNTARVLTSGCDLAAATGGTWDGPSFFTCSDGESGDLAYVDHGPALTPILANPTLFSAFHGVGFGPMTTDIIATGANESMFRYVPFANVRPSPTLDAETQCLTPTGALPNCPGPTYRNGTAFESLNWNWSNVPVDNVIHGGDVWVASFNVIALGPPYGSIPVDACVTSTCAAGGSGSVGGTYTSARYLPGTGTTELNESFPLAVLRILFGPQLPIPATAVPPALGIPPAPPAPPLPVVSAPIAGATGTGTIPTISIQALGAGFLGAGFTRVAQRNRPVAMGQVNRSGKPPNRRKGPGRQVGRFV